MSMINLNNERIKRKFFRRLKEAMGRSPSTIDHIERAIQRYEDFTKHADFECFSIKIAIDFKDWLKKRKYRGKVISIYTYYSYLKNLIQFFTWLSGQPGYKRKITPDKIDYLTPSNKDKMIATQYIPPNFPTREYAINIFRSIEIKSEVDHRDSAIYSILHLTGMRDFAIATLPLCCFDEKKLVIDQDPREEVHTKCSKRIYSIVFNFDNKMLNALIGWEKFLVGKGFGMKDPLFPRSKLEIQKDGLCFEKATKVEPLFWKGTGRIREMMRRRTKEAGMEYFPPHSFRHLAIYLAIKYCQSFEQFKALSQNFGHEDVITILRVYANYAPHELFEILGNTDYSGAPPKTLSERMAKIENFMEVLCEKKN